MRHWLLLCVISAASPCIADDQPAVVRVDEVDSAAIRELASKRRQLEALQAEIARLEQETGFRGRVQITARCLEMPEAEARQLGVQLDQGKLSPSLTILNRDDLRRFESSAARSGVRTLADQSLIAKNGEKAESFSGGEFPVPLSGDKGSSLNYRQVGTRIEALPRSLGNRRVQVDFAVSLSEPSSKDAITVRKNVIPSVQERRVAASVELALGETGVLMFPGAASSSNPKPQSRPAPQPVSLLFLSVHEVQSTARAVD